jgi:hypothetical protein
MSALLKFFSSVIGESNKEKPVEIAVSGRELLMQATGEDNEEWLRHLASRCPTHRKAGSSISEEYERWLVQRAKAKAAAEARATRQVVA